MTTTDISLEPWMETSIRAAVSEIQRRLRERKFVLIDFRGRHTPVMTTEEMNKIIRDFMLSGKEGLG